jgi:hypothetical protein
MGTDGTFPDFLSCGRENPEGAATVESHPCAKGRARMGHPAPGWGPRRCATQNQIQHRVLALAVPWIALPRYPVHRENSLTRFWHGGKCRGPSTPHGTSLREVHAPLRMTRVVWPGVAPCFFEEWDCTVVFGVGFLAESCSALVHRVHR